MKFLRIVKFDLMNILKNPALLIVNTILPVILILIMGFITRGGYGTDFMNSYDYYGVTMMILSAMFIAMTATNAFMEESVKRGNTRIVYAPVSKTEIYMSKLVSTFILGAVSFSIIILIGQYIFGINFGRGNIFYIILLINMLSLFGCSLGVMFCCIFKSEEGANAVIQLPIMLFIFFGDSFFSISGLGKIFEEISCISPVKWVTECAFKVIYDGNFSTYLSTMIMLLLGSLLCVAVSQLLFKPEEYV